MVKNLPAKQKTWVQSLGWEDPLEKETAAHSSTLAWKIPWTEEPGRLHSPWDHKESDMTEQLQYTLISMHPPLTVCISTQPYAQTQVSYSIGIIYPVLVQISD